MMWIAVHSIGIAVNILFSLIFKISSHSGDASSTIVTGLCQHARESVDKLTWSQVENDMKEAAREREKIDKITDNEQGRRKPVVRTQDNLKLLKRTKFNSQTSGASPSLMSPFVTTNSSFRAPCNFFVVRCARFGCVCTSVRVYVLHFPCITAAKKHKLRNPTAFIVQGYSSSPKI